MDRPTRLEATYAWARANPFRFDALIVAAIGLIMIPLTQAWGGDIAGLISLGLLAPLAWRRSRPVLSTAMVAATGFLQLAAFDSLLPADAAIPVAIYAVTAYGPRGASRAAIALAFFGTLLASARYYPMNSTDLPFAVAFIGAMLLASWALGTMRRLRQREQNQLLERARLLEVERSQEIRLAATAERARIAREMHDVVAHSLSVTISQADGGRYAARTDPEAAIEALQTISVTGRQALNDMRALLGVLRQDADQPLAPQPDADVIPDLVEQVRAGGLDVTLTISGRAQKLPPGPALAAYRIVQESLTNVLKHAGPTSKAWVQLNWAPQGLEIEVLDDGRGAGAGLNGIDTAGGQGIRGMTERATLHGGRLQAGPRTGGGFIVRALLPYGGAS
ncbi:MAG TPA: histidine kinase [Kineosporiaceae bacterium]|nr:histidine kinase [Kineosporiaceae bacterium]